MGRRGPAKTPTPILKLTGSHRANRRKNEPKPENKEPTCPTWLCPEARAEWRRVVPQLKRLGMLALMDRGPLAAYCQAWGEFVNAERCIQIDGLTFISDKGNVLPNPVVGMRNTARKAVLQFSQQFGLTPSTRAHIGTGSAYGAPGGVGGAHRDAFDEIVNPGA